MIEKIYISKKRLNSKEQAEIGFKLHLTMKFFLNGLKILMGLKRAEISLFGLRGEFKSL